MNRKELKNYFKDKLDAFAQIDSRIVSLKKRLTEISSMENDSLIQVNMGICIFSISKETAEKMLLEAIEVERNYHRILQERFHRAVGVMNGEEDA